MLSFFILWISNLTASFSKKYNGLIAFVFLFIFLIIIGYRDFNIGSDTGAYLEIYKMISNGGGTYVEPLYRMLNKIIIDLGGSYRELLVVIAFIILLFFYLSIKKSSPNKVFSLFCLFSLYFLFYAMNIMRQIIAVSIVMYGYTFLARNQMWRFLLCVLMAALFHISAVVSLIALIVKKLKLSTPIIMGGITVSIVIGFLGVITRGGIFTPFLGHYAKYLLHSSFIRGDLLAPIFLSIYLSCFFIFIYYTSSTLLKQSLWIKLYFMAIICNNIFIFIRLGLRVVIFFSISEIILLPIYLKDNRIKEKNMPIIMIAIYLGGILFTLLSTNSAIERPYSNVLYQ